MIHINTEQSSTPRSQASAETAPVHTPTPWHASRKSVYVSDIHHNCLAHMLRGRNENQANAAFIVKAVNHHAALVEALDLLANAATAEANEKGAGGYMLARLSDATKLLAAIQRSELTDA